MRVLAPCSLLLSLLLAASCDDPPVLRLDSGMGDGTDASVDAGGDSEGGPDGGVATGFASCAAVGEPTGLGAQGTRDAELVDLFELGDGRAWVLTAESSGSVFRWFELGGEGVRDRGSFDGVTAVRGVAVTGTSGDATPWVSLVESRDSRPTVVAGRPFDADVSLLNPAETMSTARGGDVDSLRTAGGQLLVWREQVVDPGDPNNVEPFRLRSLAADALGRSDEAPRALGSEIGGFLVRPSNEAGAWVTTISSTGSTGFSVIRLSPTNAIRFQAAVPVTEQLSSAPALAAVGAEDDFLIVAYVALDGGVVPRVRVRRLVPTDEGTVEVETDVRLTNGAARGTDPDLVAIESFQLLAYRQELDGEGTIQLAGLANGDVIFGPRAIADVDPQGGPVRVALEPNGRGWVVWSETTAGATALRAQELDCAE